MYRVELGFVHRRLVSGASAIGRRVRGVGQRVVGIFQSGVVQDVASDVEDVVTFVGGRRVDPVPLTTSTVTTPSASTPAFQTRTSLARQKAQSANLPLLIGAGALVAVLLLRK